MMRNLIVLGCAGLLAIGLSLTGYAGAPVDTDGDGVPDLHDNCIFTENGPSAFFPDTLCDAQEDGDLDGYGNVCDCDINGNGQCDINDIFSGGPDGYVKCFQGLLGANCGAPGSGLEEYNWNCNAQTVGDVSDLVNAIEMTFPPGPGVCSGIPCFAGGDPISRGTGSGLSCASLSLPGVGACNAGGFAANGGSCDAIAFQCP